MPSKRKKFNARFPPARIKKIMQTDEDVGKVAAAVPVIISRSLEQFIESLIVKCYETAKGRNAKTLTPSHIKQTILNERKFDFLKELVQNVSDVQADGEEGEGSGGVTDLPSTSQPKGRSSTKQTQDKDSDKRKGRKSSQTVKDMNSRKKPPSTTMDDDGDSLDTVSCSGDDNDCDNDDDDDSCSDAMDTGVAVSSSLACSGEPGSDDIRAAVQPPNWNISDDGKFLKCIADDDGDGNIDQIRPNQSVTTKVGCTHNLQTDCLADKVNTATLDSLGPHIASPLSLLKSNDAILAAADGLEPALPQISSAFCAEKFLQSRCNGASERCDSTDRMPSRVTRRSVDDCPTTLPCGTVRGLPSPAMHRMPRAILRPASIHSNNSTHCSGTGSASSSTATISGGDWQQMLPPAKKTKIEVGSTMQASSSSKAEDDYDS